MKRLLGLSLLNAALALLLLPCAALAGGKATIVTTTQPIQQPGRSSTRAGTPSTMAITWRDAETMRMDPGDSADYMLVRDGKAYSVSQDGGETMVMDLAGMSAMVQAMASQGGEKKNPFGSIDSVEATGATQTVAGVTGRVYHMKWTDPDGSRKSGDAVLTDDPLAVEMTRTYFSSMGRMFAADAANAFLNALPDNDRGLLRMGNQFHVESISRADPPDATFELPAKPVTLKELMSGMGNG